MATGITPTPTPTRNAEGSVTSFNDLKTVTRPGDKDTIASAKLDPSQEPTSRISWTFTKVKGWMTTFASVVCKLLSKLPLIGRFFSENPAKAGVKEEKGDAKKEAK